MRIWRCCRAAGILAAAACFALSGCVLGYGHCLFVKPIKNTVTGRVHFRDYPLGDGMDHVPLLALDSTAYIYSPAHSRQCLSANDLQLIGVAEFPRDVIDGSRVIVHGTLFEASDTHQHTPFLMNVISILPVRAAPR